MKKTSLWTEIEADENYGAKWKAAGKSPEQIEQLIASEVHARFVGEGGQQFLDKLAQEKGAKGIIGFLLASFTMLSFALGDPDRHKREWWRRMWIYQVKRLLLDAESGMPSTKIIQSFITMMQSPIAGVSTLNSWLYLLTGLTNGDLYTDIKSGDHKGENRYWRNVKKFVFPVFKDIEQLQKLDEEESVFTVFKSTPSNY